MARLCSVQVGVCKHSEGAGSIELINDSEIGEQPRLFQAEKGLGFGSGSREKQ